MKGAPLKPVRAIRRSTRPAADGPAGPLILASESPRRRGLLATFGIPFRVIVPAADEATNHHQGPAQLVRDNARLKADAVARRLRQGRANPRGTIRRDAARGVILAADTIVVLSDRSAGGRVTHRILGKPQGMAGGIRMLRLLSGRTHDVYTGVCIADAASGKRSIDVSRTRVTMRPLTDAEITRYLRRTKPWDKAGAYAVQDLRGMLIDRIDGSLSNVIGLPLDIVERRLRARGVLR